MSEPKNSLPSMGTSASSGFKNASAEVTKGKLVKKGHSKSVDPAKQAKASRSNKKGSSRASYGVKVSIPAYKSPEASSTLANGRLFSAAVKRVAPNFSDGISSQS